MQSSQRTHIERSFGILMARWGVLWRPLRCCCLRRAQRTITCCMLLHNICLERRVASLSHGMAEPGDNDSCARPIRTTRTGRYGVPVAEEQHSCARGQSPFRPKTRSGLRDAFVESLRHSGARFARR